MVNKVNMVNKENKVNMVNEGKKGKRGKHGKCGKQGKRDKRGKQGKQGKHHVQPLQRQFGLALPKASYTFLFAHPIMARSRSLLSIFDQKNGKGKVKV